MAFDLSNYVDVRQRIQMFKEKYPNGSLQPANLEKPYSIEKVGDRTYIVYVAAAYRTPDDPRPGVGSAFEVIPGLTTYTKDSELMNAETSAWGRAIVAVLAMDSMRAIASLDEVRNRQPEREKAQSHAPASPTAEADVTSFLDRPASAKQVSFVRSILAKLELSDKATEEITGVAKLGDLTMGSAKSLLDGLLKVQKGEARIAYSSDGVAGIQYGASDISDEEPF